MQNLVVIVVIFQISLSILETSSQILNTFHKIQDWAVREEKIYHLAKARIKRLQLELFELEGYVKDYDDTTVRHLVGITEDHLDETDDQDVVVRRAKIVASNALLIHRMSHRFATKFTRLQRALLKVDEEGDALKDILGAFVNPKEHPDLEETDEQTFGKLHTQLPGKKDLANAIESLETLYETYSGRLGDVTTETFASLISSDTTQPIEIDAYHASKLSLTAFYQGMYGNAIDWIVYAQERVTYKADDSISSDLVLYMREYMFKTHNEELEKPQSRQWPMIPLNFFETPVNDSIFTDRSQWEHRRNRQLAEYLRKPVANRRDLAYYALCQGESRLTEKQKSKLKCYLDYKIHSYFTIGPVKVEELSNSASKILKFYDVLNPKEIKDTLDTLKTKKFEQIITEDVPKDRSFARAPLTRTGVEAKVSAVQLKQLGIKAELLTGLSVLPRKTRAGVIEYDKENFIATEYVAGRFYADVVPSKTNEKVQQNHIGTLLFYLNDVEVGGETPFYPAGTYTHPRRGSAVYWESTDGHGLAPSCPVVEGHKITISKDFYFSNQKFHSKQCSFKK